jgi:hypothetical protein
VGVHAHAVDCDNMHIHAALPRQVPVPACRRATVQRLIGGSLPRVEMPCRVAADWGIAPHLQRFAVEFDSCEHQDLSFSVVESMV